MKARGDYIAAIEDRILRMEVVINAAGLAAEPREPESVVDEIGGQAELSDRMSTLVIGKEGASQFIGEADAAYYSACINACQEHRPPFLSSPHAVCSGSRGKPKAMKRTD